MGMIAIGAGICMGLAALGVGIGQGILSSSAMNGMSRQPEISSKMAGYMIVGMAIMETALVLTFVIAIIMTGKI